jgi:hypothetical protein
MQSQADLYEYELECTNILVFIQVVEIPDEIPDIELTRYHAVVSKISCQCLKYHTRYRVQYQDMRIILNIVLVST